MGFIDIGFGNIASADRIVCVVSADSSPVRRMITDCKDRGACVDCCAGKKCRAVLVTDCDGIILSSMEVGQLAELLGKKEE